MLLIREIQGRRDEPRFAGRRVDPLPLDSSDAGKRRLRATTAGGLDVALDLERGAYLFDGALLHDDGERVIVVERSLEEALIVRFPDELDRARLLEHAVRLGHAFGNQHVAIEVEGDELRVPITTSREVVAETVERLGLVGVELRFGHVALGRDRRLLAPEHRHP
jgi:urease accessory protein